jgi:hypothetical protein
VAAQSSRRAGRAVLRDRGAAPDMSDRIERTLEFAARARVVSGVPLLALFRALFARLANRSLPETPTYEDTNKYNWGRDESYVTAEGDGLRVAQQCFGGVPGDGIDTVFELTVGDTITISTEQGLDYSQLTLVFRVAAPVDAIDATMDALAKTASEVRLERVKE